MFDHSKTALVVIGVLSLVLLVANFCTWSIHDPPTKQEQDKDTFATFFSAWITACLLYCVVADIEGVILYLKPKDPVMHGVIPRARVHDS